MLLGHRRRLLRAIAIAILTFAPVRLSNLVQIRLDQNLIKPGGLNSAYMLVFPHYDVKNRVDLEFLFDDELTALIDKYIHQFRSTLLRGSNDLWLFPGESGGCKDAKTFSGQITERVEKATGLCITGAGCDLIVLGTIVRDSIVPYATARKIGWTDVDFLGSAASYDLFVATAQGGVTEGLYAMGLTDMPYRDLLTPAAQDWFDRYKDRFKAEPNIGAFYGYDAADLTVLGFDRAGPNLTLDSFINGLESIKNYHDHL